MKHLTPMGFVAALSLFAPIQAQTVSTEPVGSIALSPLPNSDTPMSIPLNRPAAFKGAVASVSGSRVQVQGTPGWTSNQFVYAAGTQPNTYYLSVAGTGSKSGMFYTITGNDTNGVTVDPAGDNLSTLAAGTEVRIIPYWTFGTLFPNGAGVTASATHGSRPTEILVSTGTQTGVNTSFEYTYYYFSGSNPGWRRVGGGGNTVRNDDILVPDTYFIYRQNGSQQNLVTVTGSVQMKSFSTPIGTLASNTAQDNFVAFPIASSLTLAETKLYESGAFAGSSSHGTRADELLVYDYSASGYNKSPIYTYYYFTGANPGWRRVGGGGDTVRNNEVVFQPGRGFIVRKSASQTASSSLVSLTPPYAQ